MGYGWLVTTVLALHFAYVAYVVVGGFLAWRWPKAIWPHLVACAWAILIVGGWVDCPLTWAEDWARQKAGQTPLTEGFVDRYLDNVLYPERLREPGPARHGGGRRRILAGRVPDCARPPTSRSGPPGPGPDAVDAHAGAS